MSRLRVQAAHCVCRTGLRAAAALEAVLPVDLVGRARNDALLGAGLGAGAAADAAVRDLEAVVLLLVSAIGEGLPGDGIVEQIEPLPVALVDVKGVQDIAALAGIDLIHAGVVRENARAQVRCLMSERSIETKKRLIRTAMKHANETGVTSVQTCDVRMGDWESTLEAYNQVLAETPTVRVYHQFSFMEPNAFQEFLDKGYRTGVGNDFNRFGPLKLFVDGSLGARTAYMREPYADDPSTRGIATLTPEEIDTLVGMAVKNNCGVAVHAIGDAAIENVLNAYDKVCENGENPLRLGIIHVQITDRPLLERFTKNDILALVQPIFLHYDTAIVEDRVGKDLAATSYAFKTLMDLGVHTSYGTDSPVEDMDPIANLYCAVTRKNLRGEPAGGWHPEECVDIYSAVDAYTIESAYASFDEKVKGRLMKGYLADLVVLSDNIFTINPDDILKVKVDATMVNGNFVFQRN